MKRLPFGSEKRVNSSYSFCAYLRLLQQSYKRFIAPFYDGQNSISAFTVLFLLILPNQIINYITNERQRKNIGRNFS